MCLAIVKPGSVNVPEEHLAAGWQANSDGGGFAYVEDGKVQFQKGFLKYQDFLTAYKATSERLPNSPFLIHFRIASMGAKGADNTHPFPVPGGALIHNGTLDGTGAKYNDGPSDTCLFAEKFGAYLTHDVVKDNKDKFDSAANHSKIAFLYDDGRYAIVNEKLGGWNEGVWYSNRSYEPRVRSTGRPAGSWGSLPENRYSDCGSDKHSYCAYPLTPVGGNRTSVD